MHKNTYLSYVLLVTVNNKKQRLKKMKVMFFIYYLLDFFLELNKVNYSLRHGGQ